MSDKTKVTTLRREKIKTNISPDEARQAAMATHIEGLEVLKGLTKKLSKKQMRKVFFAVLQLPEEDLPSDLRNPAEQDCFVVAQQVQNARLMILNYSIYSAMMEEKAVNERLDELEKEKKDE